MATSFLLDLNSTPPEEFGNIIIPSRGEAIAGGEDNALDQGEEVPTLALNEEGITPIEAEGIACNPKNNSPDKAYMIRWLSSMKFMNI
jgi:hypothetical protein